MDAEILDLSATNNVHINLSVRVPDETMTLGSQFGFLILPLGRIELQDTSSLLYGAATRALSLRGYQPFRHSPDARLTLYLNLKHLSLSGYDTFVTRRIALSTELAGELRSVSQSGTEALLGASSIRHEGGGWERYAFQRELSARLGAEMIVAVEQILDDVGLTANSGLRRSTH